MGVQEGRPDCHRAGGVVTFNVHRPSLEPLAEHDSRDPCIHRVRARGDRVEIQEGGLDRGRPRLMDGLSPDSPGHQVNRMAYSATYTVSIKAPQPKVFEYLSDVARHGEGGSSDDRMKIAAEKPGAPAVGGRYQADALLNGKQNKSVVTITAREPTTRIPLHPDE